MINVQNVSLSFGTQKIFNHLSCIINGREKIGLVGLNGSGKSTLLKLIVGKQQYDEGTVSLASHKKIGYMAQEVVLTSVKSVIDETMSAVEIIDEENSASVCAHAKKILMGLGFSVPQMEQSVSNLSVGWRMRVILAQLLLQNADFYLFDEPTNHLDIVAKQWFLTFLKKAPFGFMLVCHDRYFLDHLCDSIFELEQGNGTLYKGNYSAYEEQKKERHAALSAAYVQQQKEIKRKQAIIDKFRAGTRATQAKSMEKALEKIERIVLPTESKKVTVKLPAIVQPGRVVITVKNVRHAFDTKQIFQHISFIIERNEKVALIAANGIGKTTLLNVIMGNYPLQAGEITFGYKVIPAIFEQDQVRALNPEKTLFETLQDNAPQATEIAIRNMLGCFLFTQDMIYKKTKVLSGGERNRLSMARVLLQEANVLLLDEPTNHLDMPSKDILLQALQTYQGTILFVSHDQDFINNLATHVIELTPTGAYKYEGNYEQYLYQKQSVQDIESGATTVKEKKPMKSDRTHYKEMQKLENQIDKIEKEINTVAQELADYAYGSEEFSTRYALLSELQKKQALLLRAWEDKMKV